MLSTVGGHKSGNALQCGQGKELYGAGRTGVWGSRCCSHAFLPYLLDDGVPEERALAVEFGKKLLALCTRLVVYGSRVSAGMQGEIAMAEQLGIPIYYRTETGGVRDAM
ncbi:hypothetical protein BIV19_15455 [Intestinimonas butyriciproducens]|nr:hypothetical protein BIV19_15455 [Intestinimonas butyriciproducens]